MDGRAQSDSRYQFVVRILTELGIADAASLTRTVLIQDRQCVGHRYRCSGGQAVWWIVRNLVEFFGPDGRPLKVIQVEPSQESVYQKAAA
jgi:hypothetical protein